MEEFVSKTPTGAERKNAAWMLVTSGNHNALEVAARTGMSPSHVRTVISHWKWLGEDKRAASLPWNSARKLTPEDLPVEVPTPEVVEVAPETQLDRIERYIRAIAYDLAVPLD